MKRPTTIVEVLDAAHDLSMSKGGNAGAGRILKELLPVMDRLRDSEDQRGTHPADFIHDQALAFAAIIGNFVMLGTEGNPAARAVVIDLTSDLFRNTLKKMAAFADVKEGGEAA